jgi:hypothetical protein
MLLSEGSFIMVVISALLSALVTDSIRFVGVFCTNK